MQSAPITAKQVVLKSPVPEAQTAAVESDPIVRLTPTASLTTYPPSKALLDWAEKAPIKTIPQMFKESVRQFGDRGFLGAKRDKAYRFYTYKEVGAMADQFSSALVRLGLPAGNRVGIISPNEVHWPVTDIGTQQVGGIVTPLFPELGPADIQYMLKDSSVKICVVGNEKELQRLISVEKNLPDLEHIVILKPTQQKSTKKIWTFDEFLKMGADSLPQNRREIEYREGQIKATDIATVVYTSGTTSEPKGTMLAHGAIVSNIEGVSKSLQPEPSDREFSALPLNHIFERSVYYAIMHSGASSAYTEGLLRMAQNMKESQPTMIPGVPRVFDSLVGRMEAEADRKAKYVPPQGFLGRVLGTKTADAPDGMIASQVKKYVPKWAVDGTHSAHQHVSNALHPTVQALRAALPQWLSTRIAAARKTATTALETAYNAKDMAEARKAAGTLFGTLMYEKAHYPSQMFHWGMKTNKAYNKIVEEAKVAHAEPQIPLQLEIQHRLANKFVFPKVQEGLGGKVRLMVAGGAPLGTETDQAMRAVGPNMLVGYGMTEHPVISFNPPEDPRNMTAGRIVPGVEVKIAEDGEILVKSPSTMNGYLNKPQDTADTIDAEGWLHTGDIGVMKDGYLTITDRKKNLLVLSNGKKVPPAPIEGLLEATKYIDTAVCLGDNQNSVGALIVPKFAALEAWAKEHNIPTDHATLVKNPEVVKLIRSDVQAACAELSDYEKVHGVAILDHEFSKDTGELTETLKVKRNVVKDMYKTEIATLWRSDGSDS